MNRHFIYGISAFLCVLIVQGAAPVTGRAADIPIWAPPALAGLIEEGLEHNQSISSLKAKVEALNEKVPYSESLPDPRLGIGLLNVPADDFRFDQDPMTQKQIFVAQKFPWFGKRGLFGKQAQMAAAGQASVLSAEQLALAEKIANSYYELGFIAQNMDINRRLTRMLKQVQNFAENRYVSGQGLQQDIFQAQVELSKLADEDIMLEKKQKILQNRINALLNRETFTPVKPPVLPVYPDLRFEVSDLSGIALKQNPMLAAKKAEAHRAGIGIALARKDYWPDMDVKLAYSRRDEDRTGRSLDNLVSASVAVNLPVWRKNRQDRNLASARAGASAAENAFRDLKVRIPLQTDSAVKEIKDLQKSYLLYRDSLLPQAGQWARSAVNAYEVGKLEFNTMIGARIRLLKFELQADRRLFSIYQKRAELEALLGGPLPAQNKGVKPE